MFASVFVRKLKPGRTHEDFVQAWYPHQGFGLTTQGPFVGRNLADDSEILAIALMDLDSGETLEQVMTRIAAQEATRHTRINDVIESTTLRGIYEILNEFNFSTHETVATGRPPGLAEPR